jgi:hypothetical protein
MSLDSRSPNSREEWVRAFAGIGIPAPAFDEHGCLSLTIDNRHRIDCKLCRGGLVLQGTIGEAPLAPGYREMHLTRVLRQVTAHARTRLEHVTLSASGDMFLLQRRLADSCPASEFDETVDAFIEALLAWKKWLQGVSRRTAHGSAYRTDLPLDGPVRRIR